MIDSVLATPMDAETLLGLMEQFYAEERYPFDRERARAALVPMLSRSDLGRIWVYRDAARAVGYFVLTLGWSLEYGGRDAFVDELFVLPSHRGLGLGKRALETMKDACLELGVRALHLEVEKENLGPRELYQKTGFQDHDRFLMTLRLEP